MAKKSFIRFIHIDVLMTEPKYQVQIAEGLSKAYEAHKLRWLRDREQIDDEAACTPDGGKTWVELASILASDSSHSSVVAADQSAKLSNAIHRPSTVPDPHVDDKPDLPPKMTAQEMFERRGRHSPTRPTPARPPLPRPAPSSPDKSTPENQSDATHAANVALKTIRRQEEAQRRGSESDSSASNTRAENRTRFSFLRPMAAGALGGLIAAVIAYCFVPADSVPDSHSVEMNNLLSDESFQTMTPAELTARVHILGVQLNHVASETSVDMDTVAIPTALRLRDLPSVPLLPYVPPARTPEQALELKTMFEQYARLVRTQGADGRKMDSATVTRFTERLAKMIASPGTLKSTRAEAAHDIAEKCKLLYLLQLSNTRSADPARQQIGRAALFDAANAGLGTLFAEFSAQDLGYINIYSAADADVQPELILIRYWCHRCTDIASANVWMNQMLRLCKDEHIAYVKDSVKEVDGIE